MKRVFSLLLVLALTLSLAACGDKGGWQEQYDLGQKYLTEGNYEEAILAFTAAIEIDPKQPLAYVGRGRAYIASGATEDNLAAAQADFETAIGLDDSLAEAYLGLAEVYIAQGAPERAEALLDQAMETVDETESLVEAKEALTSTSAASFGEMGEVVRTERKEAAIDNKYYINEYDAEDRLVRSTMYHSDGRVSAFWEYDIAGNMVGMIIYAEDGSFYHVGEFSAVGETRETTYWADGTVEFYEVWEYDSAGNMVRHTWYNGDDTVNFYTIYEYDADGNVIQWTEYNADGTERWG